jgi:hypothetical protein
MPSRTRRCPTSTCAGAAAPGQHRRHGPAARRTRPPAQRPPGRPGLAGAARRPAQRREPDHAPARPVDRHARRPAAGRGPGHSIVRPSYPFDDLVRGRTEPNRTPIFSADRNPLANLGFRPLPPKWGFRWKYFFEGSSEPNLPRPSYRIDSAPPGRRRTARSGRGRCPGSSGSPPPRPPERRRTGRRRRPAPGSRLLRSLRRAPVVGGRAGVGVPDRLTVLVGAQEARRALLVPPPEGGRQRPPRRGSGTTSAPNGGCRLLRLIGRGAEAARRRP